MKSNKLAAFFLVTLSLIFLMSSSEGFTGTVPGKRDSFRMVSICEYLKNMPVLQSVSNNNLLKRTLSVQDEYTKFLMDRILINSQ